MGLEDYHNGSINPFITLKNRFDDSNEETYSSKGPYLDFAKQNILSNKIVTLRDKVPQNQYKFTDKPVEYPITIALYGLEQYSKLSDYKYNQKSGYVKGDKVSSDFINSFKNVVEWVLNNQDADSGAWNISFEYEFAGGRCGPAIDAPWPSSLAQGYCLSVLARASFLEEEFTTGEMKKFAELSKRALAPFRLDSNSGGFVTYFTDRISLPFYEEYPTLFPSRVLNGFMFSLLGLYDCYTVFDLKEAKTLFDEGMVTLMHVLPYYDLGNRSAYDLSHLNYSSSREHFAPNPARSGYHHTHLKLLYALNSVSHFSMEELISRWSMYLDGESLRNN